MNEDARRQETLQLKQIEVLVRAMEQRAEVFQIVDQAPDERAAVASLSELLEVDQEFCHAVLQLQVRSWFGSWRDGLVAQAERIRAELGSDGPES